MSRRHYVLLCRSGGLLTLCCQTRWIHARSERMGIGERQRRASREKDVLRNPAASKVVLVPTDVSLPGRSNANAKVRRLLQMAKTSGDVLSSLDDAVKAGNIDVSVFGAAMQRCGQGRWWTTLQEVSKIRRESGTESNWVLTTIQISALAKAVRGEHGYGVDTSRQQQLLQLAKSEWSDQDPSQVSGIALGAAWNVCAVCAQGPSRILAASWAEELMDLATLQQAQLSVVEWAQYLQVLEATSQTQRVNELIHDLHANGYKLNSTTLSALVNINADQRNSVRAQMLWDVFVWRYSVEPAITAYMALAKANLLAGMPACAAVVITDMLSSGVMVNGHIAHLEIQVHLIMFHSSLSVPDKIHLCNALERGQAHLKKGSAIQRADSEKFERIAKLLFTKPLSVRFSDVLVEWKCRERSVMKYWHDFEAGSRYLERHATARTPCTGSEEIPTPGADIVGTGLGVGPCGAPREPAPWRRRG